MYVEVSIVSVFIGKLYLKNHSGRFIIPVLWRKQFQIEEGKIVYTKLEKKSMILTKKGDATDNASVVGANGATNIPKEFRDFFKSLGIAELGVVDEERQLIILKPFQT
jgi:bifunctional DNA-binding transcriptional regulator/antitoxin component of YhaV-PrlF toxin-antitoxin module